MKSTQILIESTQILVDFTQILINSLNNSSTNTRYTSLQQEYAEVRRARSALFSFLTHHQKLSGCLMIADSAAELRE